MPVFIQATAQRSDAGDEYLLQIHASNSWRESTRMILLSKLFIFAMLQQSMTLLHGTLVKVIQYIAYYYSRFIEFPKRIVQKTLISGF
jgi:hypothetical protein